MHALGTEQTNIWRTPEYRYMWRRMVMECGKMRIFITGILGIGWMDEWINSLEVIEVIHWIGGGWRGVEVEGGSVVTSRRGILWGCCCLRERRFGWEGLCPRGGRRRRVGRRLPGRGHVYLGGRQYRRRSSLRGRWRRCGIVLGANLGGRQWAIW